VSESESLGRLRILHSVHGCTLQGTRNVWWSSGGGNLQSDELEQLHSRSAMDRVRGVWMSQDRRPEEHTRASVSAMVVMDRLSQVGT
jgi:hypothetical protein